MIKDKIISDYFEWLVELVCGERYSEATSYRRLLQTLHSIEFTYFVPNDQNRAADGEDLRYRYFLTKCDPECEELILESLYGPCSVLEMMIALSLRCEENIMDDPSVGDRSAQWFWNMIDNLGLKMQTDSNFNEIKIISAISRLVNREYDHDGRGGLFTVNNCPVDMRKIEIWSQMWRFIDTIS